MRIEGKNSHAGSAKRNDSAIDGNSVVELSPAVHVTLEFSSSLQLLVHYNEIFARYYFRKILSQHLLEFVAEQPFTGLIHELREKRSTEKSLK